MAHKDVRGLVDSLNNQKDFNDKSIDTEHKIIAREMIKMQRGLNKDFFSQMGDSLQKQKNTLQITCWTCHHGNKNPQLFRPKE